MMANSTDSSSISCGDCEAAAAIWGTATGISLAFKLLLRLQVVSQNILERRAGLRSGPLVGLADSVCVVAIFNGRVLIL